MRGQMDVCCNREWGGERGRLAGMVFASKCMRHRSYSKMHKCTLSLTRTHTYTHILIGFGCFLDNSIVFSGIRGGSCVYVFVCLIRACVFDTVVKSLLVKKDVAKIAKQGHLFW